MKILLRVLLGLVASVVAAVGAATFYLAATLGIIDVPWLSDAGEDVIPLETERAESVSDVSQVNLESAPLGAAQPRPAPVQARAVAEIEELIGRDLQDDDHFDITLTESEINRLLLSGLPRDARIRNLDVGLTPDLLTFDGELKGRIPVPFHGSLTFILEGGKARVNLQEVRLGVIPLAGFARAGMNTLLNEIGNLNKALAETGEVEITEIELRSGSMRIAGRRRGTALAGMPNLNLERPEVDLAVLPKPRIKAAKTPAATPAPGAWLYLSLGDSLAAGEGATSSTQNYVTGFWQYLEETYRVAIRFSNLGISGESTNSFVRRADPQIRRAIAEIERLQNDGLDETLVHAITLSLGANDIFPVLQSDDCTEQPMSADCQRELDRVTDKLEQNMDVILRALREAAGPDTLIILLTYYNPFDLGTGLPFEEVSDQTLDRLNRRIINVAARHNVSTANSNAVFADLAPALTHILTGDIHPRDSGYDALLLAFQDAYERAGPFEVGSISRR